MKAAFLEPVENYRGYTIKLLLAETFLCNLLPNGRPGRSRPQNKQTIVFPGFVWCWNLLWLVSALTFLVDFSSNRRNWISVIPIKRVDSSRKKGSKHTHLNSPRLGPAKTLSKAQKLLNMSGKSRSLLIKTLPKPICLFYYACTNAISKLYQNWFLAQTII